MEKSWNIMDILNWTVEYLEKKDIKEAKYKTELLLCKILELKRFELYLNFDQPLSQKERAEFKLLLNRLTEHEPIQYILGKWEFYAYEFIVNKNVLIPRRETEELVEKVIKYISKQEYTETKYIVDVGTGSGAIIISLFLELKKLLKEEQFNLLKFIATDISEKALETAKENAVLNNINETEDKVEIEFVKTDILYGLKNNIDILVSNPPYVSISEYNKLEKELFFEPKRAITDNSDGIFFYIKLINEIMERNINKSFFEIGYNQKEALEQLCIKNNIENFKFHKDLSGNYRILEIDK